jgi:hypothetical protein
MTFRDEAIYFRDEAFTSTPLSNHEGLEDLSELSIMRNVESRIEIAASKKFF